MKNKKGSQLIEAAMVLPLLILTIVSLIFLTLYFYHCLQAQTEAHSEMIQRALCGDTPFEIYEKNTETSGRTDGIVQRLMKKEQEYSIYLFNGADFVRAGEMIGFE